MSDDDAPGIPASIAGIMAAIRREVARGPAGTGPADAALAAIDPEPPRDRRDPDAGADAGAVAAPDAGALPPDLATDVRAALAPLLKAWLDAHLPEIVEAAVATEIRRLTGLA